MIPTPAPTEYLNGDYDCKRLTIAQLCSILSKHNIALPSSRQQKHVYLDLFYTEIIEKSEDLLLEIENVQPSSVGMEFMKSKIPIKKAQEPEKPNLMNFAKKLPSDQIPNAILEKRKEFDGSKSPEKRFKPMEGEEKPKTLNVFRKPPSPMMLKSIRLAANAEEAQAIAAPKSQKFSVLPTLPGVRTRIAPSSPHVIADRLKPVKEMVAKFDDGVPVKPRELYQRFNADSDSTLSDAEDDVENILEEDSFYEKMLDQTDLDLPEKLLDPIDEMESENWRFEVQSIRPGTSSNQVVADDGIEIAKTDQESALYLVIKISLYAIILAFAISIIAGLTEEFDVKDFVNQAQESAIFARENPQEAWQLITRAAVRNVDDLKRRALQFDLAASQQRLRDYLVGIFYSVRAFLEEIDLYNSFSYFVDAVKARVHSFDSKVTMQLVLNFFEKLKAFVYDTYSDVAGLIQDFDLDTIKAKFSDLGSSIISGQVYASAMETQEKFWKSSFATQSVHYYHHLQTVAVDFSYQLIRFIEAAYSMLSASVVKTFSHALNCLNHPGFDETRLWISQSYANIHNALNKQSSVILKSQLFRSGLSRVKEMLQKGDWNFLDSTGTLLIAGGTTVGFIALALIMV